MKSNNFRIITILPGIKPVFDRCYPTSHKNYFKYCNVFLNLDFMLENKAGQLFSKAVVVFSTLDSDLYLLFSVAGEQAGWNAFLLCCQVENY